MRMWMVDVTKMCRQHLLGEHREIHTMIGTIRKGVSLNGYLEGLYDISKLIDWHKMIVEEMKRRGYNHQSPISSFDKININTWLLKNKGKTGWIDVKENEKELKRRCKECKF